MAANHVVSGQLKYLEKLEQVMLHIGAKFQKDPPSGLGPSKIPVICGLFVKFALHLINAFRDSPFEITNFLN